MLVNCKPGCTGKKITTNASLDVEQDEAVCTVCREVIPVSKFTKVTMKQQGDIFHNNSKKSFQFNCLTCKKKVQAHLEGSNPVGVGCSGGCEFNISKFILIAMSNVQKTDEKVEKQEPVDNLEDLG